MNNKLPSAAAALILGAASMVSNVQAAPRTAFVHLFEWSWNEIGIECEQHLGPKGFSAVQISPPQEHVGGSPWWTRYQPVSYNIESRSGSRSEFMNMVARCNSVGVDIYADMVINHMAAHDRYFPSVPYYNEHFHSCTTPIDYSNRWQVQNCDLVGLNDLATENEYVRQKIADYFNDLIFMGVKGFRIDAAKHIPVQDIEAILNKVQGNPYIFQEVIGAADEPIQPSEYTHLGDVTEFNFERTMGHYFKGRGPIADLKNIDTHWGGWLPSDNAVIFTDNHDDQRQKTNDTLTYKDGDAYHLGNVFMLAYPYGYPKVMSSYYFDDHDQGPPSSGAYSGNGCFDGDWVCEHRWRGIANMVSFRNHTAEQFVASRWWDNGNHQIAFSRGGLGFVAINREGNQTLDRTFATDMPQGDYCDIINGDFNSNKFTCTGPIITVDGAGNAHFSVPAMSASAIHVGAMIQDPCDVYGLDCSCDGGVCPPEVPVNFSCADAETDWGQSVYVTGNTPALGNNDPAQAVKLDPTAYPTWTGTIDVPANMDISWACLKRDEQDPDARQASSQSQLFHSGSAGTSTTISFKGTQTTTVDINFTCHNGDTYMGQSVYVVGNHDKLGNWDPAQAVKLDPTSYPSWSGSINLPNNTDFEWKCLKREENNAIAGLSWQNGSNNGFNSGQTQSADGAF
ncbi:carbohydrate-binding module family 20 domain-containing protein [Corallincola luteus]|nr:carbohydrate-binding module family 20 domain-containing protein [Corallincola luteus]